MGVLDNFSWCKTRIWDEAFEPISSRPAAIARSGIPQNNAMMIQSSLGWKLHNQSFRFKGARINLWCIGPYILLMAKSKTFLEV
jgi:hypothetical protein